MGFRREEGQMLLVVVLTMVVALTVGLSVVSRTITNLKLSKQNEESQRAFQAAEAGIEQAIQSPSDSFTLPFSENNAKYSTNSTVQSGSSLLLNGGDSVDQDTGIDVWLSNHPDFTSPITGQVTFYWNTNNQTVCGSGGGGGTAAALELVVLSGVASNPTYYNPTMAKYFFDGCSNRRTQNNASAAGSGGGVNGETFSSSATISITNGLIMRVIPIYNSTKVGILTLGGLQMPPQGTVIESVGTSGDTIRKVRYFSSNPQVPLEIFPYSVITQ